MTWNASRTTIATHWNHNIRQIRQCHWYISILVYFSSAGVTLLYSIWKFLQCFRSTTTTAARLITIENRVFTLSSSREWIEKKVSNMRKFHFTRTNFDEQQSMKSLHLTYFSVRLHKATCSTRFCLLNTCKCKISTRQAGLEVDSFLFFSCFFF